MQMGLYTSSEEPTVTCGRLRTTTRTSLYWLRPKGHIYYFICSAHQIYFLAFNEYFLCFVFYEYFIKKLI